MTSLALYLLNKDSLNKFSAATYPFQLQSKSQIQLFGKKLLKQLFEIDSPAESTDDDKMTFAGRLPRWLSKRSWSLSREPMGDGEPKISTKHRHSSYTKMFPFVRSEWTKRIDARPALPCFVRHSPDIYSKWNEFLAYWQFCHQISNTLDFRVCRYDQLFEEFLPEQTLKILSLE